MQPEIRGTELKSVEFERRKLVRKAVDFHGHLGPFLIIGIRMGLTALEKLRARRHSLKALAKTGTKPPVSCIIDGVQVSTGCTLGRGNIEVDHSQEPRIIFWDGARILEIELKREIFEKILESFKTKSSERITKKLIDQDEEELFNIRLKLLSQRT
jgi:formylmethanofuran dehydrogenase subunit E